MGKQRILARNLLTNAIYDAQRAISNNQCSLAVRILRNKVDELDKLKECPYVTLVW